MWLGSNKVLMDLGWIRKKEGRRWGDRLFARIQSAQATTEIQTEMNQSERVDLFLQFEYEYIIVISTSTTDAFSTQCIHSSEPFLCCINNHSFLPLSILTHHAQHAQKSRPRPATSEHIFFDSIAVFWFCGKGTRTQAHEQTPNESLSIAICFSSQQWQRRKSPEAKILSEPKSTRGGTQDSVRNSRSSCHCNSWRIEKMLCTKSKALSSRCSKIQWRIQ